MRLPLPVVRTALALTLRPVLGPPVPPTWQRRWLDLLSAGTPLPAGVVPTSGTLGGRPVLRLVPKGADERRSVLLLHGGAFIIGSTRTHRAFAAHLAVAAGCTVHLLDYRLAPEHPWPAAVDDAVAAFDELAAMSSTSVVGDSAGGALALLLARTRRPASLGLVSPLVDLTRRLSSGYTGNDLIVRADWARQGTTAFVGDGDAQALSPLWDDLSGLPPTLVHVSEHERLRAEGEQLVARARTAGVDVTLTVLPGVWHDVHVQAGLLGVAADATAEVGHFLAAHG